MPDPAEYVPTPTNNFQVGGSSASSSPGKGMMTHSTSTGAKALPAAGFRQINTVVRRMGDLGDFYFDGSWKASSFANPPGYLDADVRTPWTRTLNYAPKSGVPGPPSLWPIDHVTSTPAVPQAPIWPPNLSLRANNIPGYKGYIPGEKVETVYGTLRSGCVDHAEKLRTYEEKDVAPKPLLYNNATIGRMSLKQILKTTDLKHTVSYGDLEPNPGNRLKQYKDHVPPARITPNPSPTGVMGWSGFRPPVNRSLDGREPAYMSYDTQAETGKDNPGYTGYRPRKFCG
ncbi:unnamed protein product [Amoebophrya sp. A25]|nr:unnamed protein product [Amoebophrya sp. A25]|eukprot:GSA25T00010517001.1